MQMQFSQKGLSHQICQDSYSFSECKNCSIIAVADGQGTNGEFISASLTQNIRNIKIDQISDYQQLVTQIKQCIFDVEISTLSRDLRGGSTITVVVLFYQEKGINIACISLGDTPAYMSYKDTSVSMLNPNICYLQLSQGDQLENLEDNPNYSILDKRSKVAITFSEKDYYANTYHKQLKLLNYAVNMEKFVGNGMFKVKINEDNDYKQNFLNWINVKHYFASYDFIQKYNPQIFVGSDGVFCREPYYQNIHYEYQKKFKYQHSTESFFRFFYEDPSTFSHRLDEILKFYQKLYDNKTENLTSVFEHLNSQLDYVFCYSDDLSLVEVDLKKSDNQNCGQCLEANIQTISPSQFSQILLNDEYVCDYCKKPHKKSFSIKSF